MKKDNVRAIALAIIVILGFYGISLFRPVILERYSSSRVAIVFALFFCWATLVILLSELIKTVAKIIVERRSRSDGDR